MTPHTSGEGADRVGGTLTVCGTCGVPYPQSLWSGARVVALQCAHRTPVVLAIAPRSDDISEQLSHESADECICDCCGECKAGCVYDEEGTTLCPQCADGLRAGYHDDC
jgi:hypothetical protein